MILGYIRVSTINQNIDRQIDMLQIAGVDRIFIDKLTGKNLDRPELIKMFDCLRKNDLVVVTELSRFGRSLSDVIKLVNLLNEKQVDFKSLKEPYIDTTTPQGRYFFNITASFNELQRELIVESTKEGLQSARARGRVGGRPKVDRDRLKIAKELYNTKKYSISEIVKLSGISKATLYNYLKEQD